MVCAIPGGASENLLILLMGLRKSELKVCNGTQPAMQMQLVICALRARVTQRQGLGGGYWALGFGEGERTQLKWSCGEQDWFTIEALD